MKLVFVRDIEKPEQRLKVTTRLMRDLSRIAERKKAA
jgi:transcription-repair coupling factor (superfamily II helicase)